MKSDNNWIVLAGGPNSGKTTLLEALRAKGFEVKEEQAMKVIHEYIDAGIALDSVHLDPVQGAKFQVAIAEKELDAQSSFNKNDLVFFDRGAVEYFAFSKLRNFPLERILSKRLKECSYRHVFMLDLVEGKYESNKIEAHLDDPIAEAKKQEKLLLEAYNATGAPITHVPPMTTEERIDFILDELKIARN